MTSKPTDKRTRLIDTATKLVHEQGFDRTTLADIAREARVPLGNVYYYFKTKDEIGHALITKRMAEYKALCAEWEQSADPRARIESFIQMTVDQSKTLSRSGCPIGSLCTELHKQRGPLADEASALLAGFLSWLEAQFRALGMAGESKELAVHFLSALEGATLLTHSFGDPKYVQLEAKRLREQLRTLGVTQSAPHRQTGTRRRQRSLG